MAEEDTEYLKLPVEERCVHKSWKARVSGYEEATKLFNRWDGDDQNWKKFLGLVKKFVTDSNAVAQEKGLEAALAFAENCDFAGKTVNECVDGLVNKCLAAPKTKTKDLAKQIILMYVEIEQHEKVIEELIKGLAQKNPKTVAGCINNMTDCLKFFGAKVIKVSPLLKAVVPLLDHRDKPVRDEGKLLIVEAYRWVGEIMKQQLSGCKPVQMTELEAEFEKLKGEKKAKPTKLLRSQQQIVASPEDEGDGAGEGAKGGEADEEEADDDTDPYDLMDPVDILEKLPKNFYELVEEKKWQLRKEALDALLPLSQNPKLAPGDYNDLIRVLKKFIAKDANVILVALAAQCLAGLAKGLRTGFKNGATQCFATVLEKFKEKKTNVVSALVEAVDAMYPCLGIEAVQEDCLEALKHKTPTVNSETAKFLTRAFAKCPAPVFTNKKMVKGYVSCLVERLNHSDPIVRDAASETLGMLVKLIGEPSMTKLMPDVDPIKMAKIKEFAEKAEITGKRPKLQPEGGTAPPPAKGGAKVVKPGGPQKKSATGVRPGAAKPKAVAKPPPPPQSSDDEEDNYEAEFAPPPKPAATKSAATSRVGSAPARKTSAPAAAARQRPGTSVGSGAARPGAAASASASKKKGDDIDPSPPYVVSNLKNIRFKDEIKFKVLKWNFATPRPEFVDQLKEQMTNANFNKTLMSQMFHNDFKQHLKAIETLAAYIDSDLEGLISNLDLILKWTTLRFFETNPSVLLRALDYLNDAFSALADDSYSLNDIEAVSFIPYLVNKVGDPKDQVRNSIRNILRSLRNVYPVSKLLPFLMDGLKSKNGKQRSECLDDLGSIIRDYGMGVLQPSAAVCLKEMAKFIGERDTSVRNAALNAVTEAFFQTGEKLYKMIGNLPEKDLSMLEERIKRVSLTRPPPGSGGPPPPAVAAPAPQPVLPSQEPRSGIPANRNRNIPAPPGGLSGLKRYQPQQPPQQQQQQPQQQPELPSNARRTSPQAGNGGMFGRDRPVSGVFSLDLEKIETSGDGYHHHSNHRISNGGPKLVAHNLDEIFGEDGSCRLPPTMSSARDNLMAGGGGVRDNHHYQPQPHHQQQQQPRVNLLDSPEAYEALDLVLSQVMSKDATLCISALGQLDELIKDREKVILLGERIDQLLISCYMQYRHVLNNKLRTDNANPKEVLRVFQYVTMVLMAIYQHPNLTKNGSTSNLQDLLNVIVCILLEPGVHHMPDGSQLVRALNVLTVKMIDRSDHTALTCAFIRLLKDTVGSSSLSQEFTEMVMKCLWRVIKILPKWMEEEGDGSVNLDDVLADVHEFLKTFPSAFWRKRDNDTPVRTIKTLLHTFVKTRGDEVLDHVTRVQDPQNSELVSYIRKLLNTGIGKENANVVRNNDNDEGSDDLGAKNGNVRSGIPTIGSSGIPRFSKGDEESLKDIFKRIGQKETTKQGLQDLYNFKQRNPHADKQLEPFLAKSSDYFRNYIERGLKGIENEASASSHNILSESGQRNSDNNSAGVGGASDAYAPKLYLDRLKMLRAQAGLDSGSASSMSSGIGMSSCMTSTTASVTSEEEISSSTSSTLTTATTQATEIEVKPLASNSGNLDDIQKRLARLKQSAR